MHAISLIQVTLLALTTSSWAYMVTKPAEGDDWSSGGPNVIMWNSVSTDPVNISLALVQGGVSKEMLANNVDGTQGSATVTASLPTGTDFQVNIVSTLNSGQILAQSSRFNITQGGSSSGASSASSISSTGTGSVTVSSSNIGNSAGASAATAAASGTNIPNASGTALNPTASSAASSSIPSHSGLIGLLALFGLALV